MATRTGLRPGEGHRAWLVLAAEAGRVGLHPTNLECGWIECAGCGADLGRSSVYPWHYPWEDCRATREPTTEGR